MLTTNPLVSRLILQLAPAALVSAIGIVLLSSLAKPAFVPPHRRSGAADVEDRSGVHADAARR